MKKVFYYFFLFLPAFVFGQEPETEKGIHFERTTFAELQAKAKKENKMIMVDAFTTWCGPCKWMDKNIFPNDTVAVYYNTNFINAKIDMEKGEGIDIKKKYLVSCYPTYLFIDGSGQLVHRISGSMESKKFIETGMNAMNPAKQFTAYQKKYDSGTITPDEMGDYVVLKLRSCLSAKDEIIKYFSTQSDADLINQRNWSILYENSMNMDINSREFKYLVDHREEYEKRYKPKTASEGTVNDVIKSSYSYALKKDIKDKKIEDYNKLKADILKKNLSFSEEVVMESDISLYRSTKDWNNYALSVVKYIDKFKKDDSNMLNTYAWDFYENVDDKVMLAKAEAWAKYSVELEPSYANTDTYAAVLYKLGKNKEAQVFAERAIELAKKEGQDYKETQALLDKLKISK